MSLENEDGSSAMEASELINESQKKPIISYTRDFLLSLSELEICKKLPSGFDHSLLSEFEDTTVDRSRTHGSVLLQGFRRNDYSSSPPTRGESSNFSSRGVYGRWDNRSSGWSDKDGSDSQSDLDPDSGRRSYGNQSRRPWQNSEHDGLLGSGSFPRPSGFGTSSAPKTNDSFQLNRSNEAYQPPRPFKAVPHPRTNTHDSFNDETFGSSEFTSQDRAEEERKRRAAFESMRKEQQKVLQEKQKSNTNKVKSDGFTDLISEETKEEEANSELNSAIPNDDSGKSSSFLLQSSKSRPLVPPGFRTTKPISSIDKENPKPGMDETHKGNDTQNGGQDNQGKIQGEAIMNSLSGSGISGFPDAAADGEVFQLMTNNVMGNKALNNPSQESTTSILGKFFGSGSTTEDGGPTGFNEQQKIKADDHLNAQSSRFAQWFNEDEKKPMDDKRPNDLLSLIVGNDKTGTQFPNVISTPPDLSYKGFGVASDYRPEPVAAVLTCEDLEQTIMSEYGTISQPPVTDWSIAGQENTDPTPVDNHATNHLLSLLQKGTMIDDITPQAQAVGVNKPKEEANLSLEALFGSAFMKELQSAQAPVSVQRGSAGSARINIDLSNGPLSSSVDTIYENNPLTLKEKEKQVDNGENWLNFNGQSAKQAVEIQLPEEESLITVGDPANTRMLPSDAAFDISEKLAALNSGFRGERSMSGDARFIRGPYEMLEPERQFNNNNNNNNLHHGQGSSPQMQMNHNRMPPMFHPLDPNQMRFPEHLNNPMNQQFAGNLARPFHHPDARVTGFDVPQMRMQGNFPPHMLTRPPSMVHPHPHPHQGANFMAEREAMHGFPFAHQQQLGGLGMPLNVGEGPEALQRMIEMELRAQQSNSKGGGGMLDMGGFRYR